MKQILIVGAGGHGKEVHQLLLDINAQRQEWDFLGFVDDDPKKSGTLVHGAPVLGGLPVLARYPECYVVIAIGNVDVKAETAAKITHSRNARFATLAHPSALIGRGVVIGEGVTICAGAILTTDIEVGAHVIVNTGAIISHDCRIGTYSTIAPRAVISGNVQIGDGVDVGAGTTIIQGLKIGSGAAIGAGAVVIADVEKNTTVVGCPARAIKLRERKWREP